jgi:hypothetical protein
MADSLGRRVVERRRWSRLEKRAIVAECLAPGTSVSAVARRHGVAAAQLFAWRRQYGDAPVRNAASKGATAQQDFAAVMVLPEILHPDTAPVAVGIEPRLEIVLCNRYDAFGRLDLRTKGSETPVDYLYDGDDLVMEKLQGAGPPLRRTVHGPGTDEPLVQYDRQANGSYTRSWLHANQQRSIIASSDDAGTVGAVYSYGPGACTGESRWRARQADRHVVSVHRPAAGCRHRPLLFQGALVCAAYGPVLADRPGWHSRQYEPLRLCGE